MRTLYPYFCFVLLISLCGCSLYRRLDEAESNIKTLNYQDQKNAEVVSGHTKLINENTDSIGLNAERIESERKRIDLLEKEFYGLTAFSASSPGMSKIIPIFANQKGKNANISISNRSKASDTGLEVMIRRIAKPGEEDLSAEPPQSSPGHSLPPNFERTKWLGLSSYGSRRDMVLPCGYELVARSLKYINRINIIVKYEAKPCTSP